MIITNIIHSVQYLKSACTKKSASAAGGGGGGEVGVVSD